MHGGGGGTNENTTPRNFKEIMRKKVEADLKDHYGGVWPDNQYWPEPVPNAAEPKYYGKEGDPNSNSVSPFTYMFCWHGEPQFIVWHRTLMMEFELLLQKYDPANDDTHEKLGARYWDWKHWGGQSLPIEV